MNKQLFPENGIPHPNLVQQSGISNICKLLNHEEDKSDLWLVFETCGKPLSKTLYEVKGEFYKCERIYSVIHNSDNYRL